MQIYLLTGIIIECVILLFLAISKKLTRRTFIGIAVFFVVCSTVLVSLQIGNSKKSDMMSQRESLYITARLLQDNYNEEAMDALSVVVDSQCMEYQVQEIRGLVLNLNEYYSTAAMYLEEIQDEMAKKIYEASLEKSTVGEDDKNEIIDNTISLLKVSEKEKETWEAKLKLLYMDADFESVRESSDTDVMAYAKAAIKDNQYKKAYTAMSEAAQRGSLREDIIVSDMYVKNYNLRTMENDDPEYDALWNDITEKQTRLNMLSVQLKEERENSDAMEGETIGEKTDLEREYSLAYADYVLAQQYMTDESIGRAQNYLENTKPKDYKTNIGYQLQMSKLYFLSKQEDMAKECLDMIFAVEDIDRNQWLGTDAYLLKEAYLLYLSDTSRAEYKNLFQQMMSHLYQGVFGEESYDDFGNFVTDYLRSTFGGLVIVSANTADFPQMKVNVSCVNENITINQNTVLVMDTNQTIDEFQIEEKKVNDLSICFVLDRSGSMSGNSIRDAKKAIQDCILSLDEFVKVSLVSFDNDAQIDCDLTGSRYLILNKLDGIDASGGTDIVAGLTTAYDTLTTAGGKKVMILLSDGYADDTGLSDILSRLKNSGIEVYAIGLEGCDEMYLQHIADATGGKYIPVTNTGELGSIYNDIQKSLIHLYTITYSNTDTEQDPRYFKIRYKDSLSQTKIIYTQEQEKEVNMKQNYNVEGQSADYFKQTGGTKETME